MGCNGPFVLFLFFCSSASSIASMDFQKSKFDCVIFARLNYKKVNLPKYKKTQNLFILFHLSSSLFLLFFISSWYKI